MATFIYRELTWAWMIIVGGVMIIPDFIICIACGSLVIPILGVISVVIGITGFVLGRNQISVGR